MFLSSRSFGAISGSPRRRSGSAGCGCWGAPGGLAHRGEEEGGSAARPLAPGLATLHIVLSWNRTATGSGVATPVLLLPFTDEEAGVREVKEGMHGVRRPATQPGSPACTQVSEATGDRGLTACGEKWARPWGRGRGSLWCGPGSSLPTGTLAEEQACSREGCS